MQHPGDLAGLAADVELEIVGLVQDHARLGQHRLAAGGELHPLGSVPNAQLGAQRALQVAEGGSDR